MATTDRVVRFPPAQPMKFQKQDDTRDPAINQLSMDKTLLSDRLKLETWYPQKRLYAQKWEQNDLFVIEFSTTSVEIPGAFMNMYRVDVNPVTEQAITYALNSATIAGNLYNGDPMKTIQITGNFSSIPRGIYQLVIGVTFVIDEVEYTDYYISEPLHIAPKHAGTALLKYKHSFNDTLIGLFYEQFDNYMGMRVPATLHKLQPSSNDTQYEDELTQMTLLNSNPYRVREFATKNIADYEGDKLNWIFSHDEVWLNNELVTKDKEAKWNIQRADNYHLASYAINVRSQEEVGVTFVTPTPPPPYVCPVVSIPFTLLPAPEFNSYDNDNVYGIDRSIFRGIADPAYVGLPAPYVYSGWFFSGNSVTDWVSGTIPTLDIHLLDDTAYDNYIQRRDTTKEAGTTIARMGCNVLDGMGCTRETEVTIDSSIIPPWTDYESYLHVGQALLGGFAGFQVVDITDTSAKIKIFNADPFMESPTYCFCLDATYWTVYDDPGIEATFSGLTPDTIYAAYAALKVGTEISMMGPFYFKTNP